MGSGLEEGVAKEAPLAGSSDERRQLISRILTSAGFCRAPQLQEFLIYISEQSLSNGPVGQVTEQIIGTEVFKRKPGYSTGDDNIVRNYARQLRKRLEEYFLAGGSDEKLIVTIPKGGYAVEFHHREPLSGVNSLSHEDLLSADVHLASSNSQTVESLIHRSGMKSASWFASWKIILPVAMCVTLTSVIAAYKLGQRNAHNDESTPALHAFWSGVLGQKRTVIVPDDTGLTIAVGLIQQDVTPEAYVSGQYRKTLGQEFPSLVNWDRPFAHRYTDLVDLLAVNRLARMPELNRQPTTIRYARDLRPEELNDGNAILFGGSNANPWVALFDRNLNFSIRFKPVERSFAIANSNPRLGESKTYPYIPYSDGQAYGLVAVRPNFKKDGNVILFEGVTNSGLQAAVDICLDERLVGELLKSVRNPDGTIRPLEVLVRTTVVGSTPTGVEVVGMRVY